MVCQCVSGGEKTYEEICAHTYNNMAHEHRKDTSFGALDLQQIESIRRKSEVRLDVQRSQIQTRCATENPNPAHFTAACRVYLCIRFAVLDCRPLRQVDRSETFAHRIDCT